MSKILVSGKTCTILLCTKLLCTKLLCTKFCTHDFCTQQPATTVKKILHLPEIKRMWNYLKILKCCRASDELFPVCLCSFQESDRFTVRNNKMMMTIPRMMLQNIEYKKFDSSNCNISFVEMALFGWFRFFFRADEKLRIIVRTGMPAKNIILPILLNNIPKPIAACNSVSLYIRLFVNIFLYIQRSL